jgi:hypothetical protein
MLYFGSDKKKFEHKKIYLDYKKFF